MRDHLIVVCKDTDNIYPHYRVAYGRMESHAYPLMIDNPKVDHLLFAEEQKTWTCTEREVAPMLEELTKKHPGWVVRAYKMTLEAERPVGEMKTKVVGKDGITPF